MKWSSKAWWRLGIGLVAGLVVVLLIVRTWAVPAVIVGVLESRYGGKVTIRDWWLNGRSAGVTGLVLHEGPAGDSPVWATAERVETDLSLGSVLRGRLSPGRLTLRSPRITFRIDRDGKPLTRPPLKGGGGRSAVPEAIVEDARVTIAQEGRPELVVSGVDARLTPGAEGASLAGKADDPVWGPLSAKGQFGEGFRSGMISLTGRDIDADRRKIACIPFVPKEVWEHVVPDGPMAVVLVMGWDESESGVSVKTVVHFRETTVDLPTLGITTTATTGPMTIEGEVVRLEGVQGRSIGGQVAGRGTLDFAKSPSQIDLNLKLDDLNVADTPKKWRLDEAGISGRLTGQVNLRVALTADGADLTGTTGDAVVKGGAIGGIPVKELRLALKAEGDELRYETSQPGSARLRAALLGLIAFQAADSPRPAPKARAKAKVSTQTEKTKGGFVLPKSISTQLELEDVDLKQVLQKVEALGVHLPFPVAGKLSLKAKATIPLGKLRDLKAYAFHGEATLRGASIAGVDLGHVAAKLDLADGVLELEEFRGRLVALPEGGLEHQPEPTDPVPAEGPLPAGGFRATLRAELSPPGRLSAHLEGDQLPLGELAAPALPRPTPLSGLVTLDARAEARVAAIADPNAWAASGHLRGERISYRETTLDSAETSFAVEGGKLMLPDLAARLGGKPLKADARLDLAAPNGFSALLDVADWDLSDVMAFVPTAPKPSPIDGALTAKVQAKGTIRPLELASEGRGKVARFVAGQVPLGDVPFRWTTEGDVIRLAIPDARPFGGRLSAEAKIPAKGGGPIRGKLDATDLDTAELSKAIPGEELTLTGKADAKVEFLVDPAAGSGGVPVQANVRLSAPDLTVQGLPAKGLEAVVEVREGAVKYDLLAESLGGKVKLNGSIPLGADSTRAEGRGEVRAVNFDLADLWRALGISGALARLDGRGAIDANLLWRSEPAFGDLRARGVAEFRDLRWGNAYPIGTLKGDFRLMPAGWRIDDLSGRLWGGSAGGSLWGERPETERGPPRHGFDLKVEEASLRDLLGLFPSLAAKVEGQARLSLTGRFDEVLRARGEVEIARARVLGLPLSDAHIPAEVSYTPAADAGSLAVPRWTARFAGGRVQGDGRLQLGLDRAFSTEAHLATVDLSTLIRVLSDVRRPASGKVSGRITLSGPDPAQPRRYRGRAVLDLDDASLVDLPVFRQLNRFLGSAQGGLFEDGDIDATVAAGRVTVNEMTLVGRTVQMHATGTVTFDTRLDLVVLVNTGELIPQSGQALVAVIPGLGDALGRPGEAVRRVGGFLSDRLLKFRVTGTLASPSVDIDPAVAVSTAAVGFFSGVLKLPLEALR